jgi:hypothetical protein
MACRSMAAFGFKAITGWIIECLGLGVAIVLVLRAFAMGWSGCSRIKKHALVGFQGDGLADAGSS